jgi:hypothetical protein
MLLRLRRPELPSDSDPFPREFLSYMHDRHVEYRDAILDHLLNVTRRHWDSSMRELGAQSLRLVCMIDLPRMGSIAFRRAVRPDMCFA